MSGNTKGRPELDYGATKAVLAFLWKTKAGRMVTTPPGLCTTSYRRSVCACLVWPFRFSKNGVDGEEKGELALTAWHRVALRRVARWDILGGEKPAAAMSCLGRG